MTCEHGLELHCKQCADELTAFRERDAVNVCGEPAWIVTDGTESLYALIELDPFLPVGDCDADA